MSFDQSSYLNLRLRNYFDVTKFFRSDEDNSQDDTSNRNHGHHNSYFFFDVSLPPKSVK